MTCQHLWPSGKGLTTLACAAGCFGLLVLALAAGALAQGLEAAFPGPQAGGEATPAAGQLVVDVVLAGNYFTKEYDIQKYIHTRKDREFDPQVVQGDVRRLVTSGLFRDVKTKLRQEPNGVAVIFELEERARIHAIKFVGNRGISEKKLNKEIGVKLGDPLNTYSAEESRRKIEELYHHEGYPNATVTLLEGDKQGDRNLIFEIVEGPVERISRVVFENNTIATDGRLKTQIQSKPGWAWYFFGGKVDRSKIDADLEKLTVYYRNLGYFKARVSRRMDYDDSGKWVTLRFIIDEGPRYRVRNVAIEGNEKFASQPLLDFLSLKSGEFFNQSLMTRDLNTLTDLYGSQGHVFADVQADPRFLEEPGLIDLVYRVKEGEVFRVGEIHVNIAGEFPHTRQTVVLNRLGFGPGEKIDMRRVRDAERRLMASQLFAGAPGTPGEPPKITIRPPEFNSTIRGQEPDAAPWSTVPQHELPRMPESHWQPPAQQYSPQPTPPQYFPQPNPSVTPWPAR